MAMSPEDLRKMIIERNSQLQKQNELEQDRADSQAELKQEVQDAQAQEAPGAVAVQANNPATAPGPEQPAPAPVQSPVAARRARRGTPTKRDPAQFITDTLRSVNQGLTFGLWDEATAAMKSAAGDKTYQEELETERGKIKQFEKDNPGVALAAEVGGSMLLPGGLARTGVVKALPQASKAVNMARGAGLGATSGAAYGYGKSEGNRALDALEGAAIGTAFGAAPGLAQMAGNTVKKAATKLANKVPEQTLQTLGNQKKAAYKKLQDLGAQYTPQQVQDTFTAIDDAFKAAGFNKRIHKNAAAAFRQLKRDFKNKTATPYQVEQMRQIVRRDVMSGDRPNKEFGQKMLDKLDDMLDNLQVAGANADEIAAVKNSARRLNSQFRKAETITNLLDEARDQAMATHSGQNINNVIRQKMKTLLKSKNARFFSKEEQEIMRKIVRGEKSENLLRMIGKLSPTNPFTALAEIGLAAGVNPGFVALPVAGFAAKRMADTRKVHQIENFIRGLSGQTPAAAQQRALSPAAQTAIIGTTGPAAGEIVAGE